MTNVISGDTLTFVLKPRIKKQRIYIDENTYTFYVVIENPYIKYVFEMIKESQMYYGLPLINLSTEITKEMQGTYYYRFFLKNKETGESTPLTKSESIYFDRSVTTIDG